MYKLLLVDDEPIIREGLERIIDWEKLDLKLTASCPNAIAALDSMTDDMPDILLTDIAAGHDRAGIGSAGGDAAPHASNADPLWP